MLGNAVEKTAGVPGPSLAILVGAGTALLDSFLFSFSLTDSLFHLDSIFFHVYFLTELYSWEMVFFFIKYIYIFIFCKKMSYKVLN